MQLLQIPSIQENLEHLGIDYLDFSKCTSVINLLAEFKRIKRIEIEWFYNDNNDEVKEWKQKIKQFNKKMKKKHLEIEISIDYQEI